PYARESELRFVGGEVERPLDIHAPRGDDASAADVEEPCGGRRRAWLDGQPEEVGVLEGEVVVIRNEQRAGLGVEAVRKRFADRVDPAAGSRARLEDRHIVSRLRELVTRPQPRQPRADDYDLLGRAGSPYGRVAPRRATR